MTVGTDGTITKLGLAVLAGLGAVPANAQDAPAPPRLEFAFEEVVKLGAATAVGETPLGRRNIIPITGGTFEGPEIKGTIVPGGWDWQLTRSDGCTEIEADYMIRTDDGVVINVINVGVLCPPTGGRASPVRTHPRFEAPKGKYEWLNRTTFIGTLEPGGGSAGAEPSVRIRFYKAL
jgi:hypothetical protein